MNTTLPPPQKEGFGAGAGVFANCPQPEPSLRPGSGFGASFNFSSIIRKLKCQSRSCPKRGRLQIPGIEFPLMTMMSLCCRSTKKKKAKKYVDSEEDDDD